MEETTTTKKILPLFFVLDSSGSMASDDQGGSPISQLNETLKEAWRELKEVSDGNPDYEIRVAVLAFNDEAWWVTSPNSLEVLRDDPDLGEIEADGSTSYAAAFEKLGKALVWGSPFLPKDLKYDMPVIIFMSDGLPNDGDPWPSVLADLKANNKWFARASRFCVPFCMDDQAVDVLRPIASGAKGEEAIVTAKNVADLKSKIKDIAVTYSMLVSEGGSTPEDALRETTEKANRD